MMNASTPFTAADLYDWLACSKEAGRRVWFTSGLFTNMQYFATGRALDRFGYHALEKQLVHAVSIEPAYAVAEEEEAELENQLADNLSEPTRFPKFVQKSHLLETLNEMASDVILDYHAWLKANKTPADFAASGIGGFLKYTKITLEHRMCDRLGEELRLIPREDLTYGEPPEEEEDFEPAVQVSDEVLALRSPMIGRADSPLIRLLGDATMDQDSKLILQEFQERCGKIILDLLAAFRQSPELAKTPSLIQRLELLSQLPESEPWETLAFLTDNHRHLEYKEFAQQQLGSTFNQNNWNSYNRRLKQKWLEFLSVYPDQDQVADLQECIQCFMEAQKL